MRNGNYIGLSLGEHFVPCNLSSFWGAEQVKADSAISRAKGIEQERRYQATIASDLMTRFSYQVATKLMNEAEALRSQRKHRNLTRREMQELDGLLTLHRKYYRRFEYFLSKLDRSAEAEVLRHFWYYDKKTGEAVDDDTGLRYRV